MLNSLIFREDGYGRIYDMAMGCAPHFALVDVERQEHDEEEIQDVRYGVNKNRGTYWLADVYLEDRILRVPRSRFLPGVDEIARTYRHAAWAHLQAKFGYERILLVEENPARRQRVNNRRRTVDVTTLPQERERGGEGVRFEMAAMGVQLRPLPVAEGADVE